MLAHKRAPGVSLQTDRGEDSASSPPGPALSAIPSPSQRRPPCGAAMWEIRGQQAAEGPSAWTLSQLHFTPGVSSLSSPRSRMLFLYRCCGTVTRLLCKDMKAGGWVTPSMEDEPVIQGACQLLLPQEHRYVRAVPQCAPEYCRIILLREDLV